MVCGVQRNLARSEASVTELEAKLRHEQEKFQSYGEALKQAEARCLDLLADLQWAGLPLWAALL